MRWSSEHSGSRPAVRMRLSILGILPTEHAAARSLFPLLLLLQEGPFPASDIQPGWPPGRGLAFRPIPSARAKHCSVCRIPLGSASGSCLGSPVQQTGDLKITVCLKGRAPRGSSVWQLTSAGIWELHAALPAFLPGPRPLASLTLGPR